MRVGSQIRGVKPSLTLYGRVGGPPSFALEGGVGGAIKWHVRWKERFSLQASNGWAPRVVFKTGWTGHQKSCWVGPIEYFSMERRWTSKFRLQRMRVDHQESCSRKVLVGFKYLCYHNELASIVFWFLTVILSLSLRIFVMCYNKSLDIIEDK